MLHSKFPDFIHKCSHLKVSINIIIPDISVMTGKIFLKYFYLFSIIFLSTTPELNIIYPSKPVLKLSYRESVYYEAITQIFFQVASCFPKFHIKFISFCFNMLLPSNLSIQGHTQYQSIFTYGTYCEFISISIWVYSFICKGCVLFQPHLVQCTNF